MKKLIAMLLALAMVFALVACGGGNDKPSSGTQSNPPASTSQDEGSASTGTDDPVSPVAGKKIAYIMLMTPATIFQMWSESMTKTAEKLGMTAETFFCADDAQQWQDKIAACAADGFDGLVVSHGGQEYAWSFLKDILEQYPDLTICTFDTPFKDENGNVQKIDGVVQFFQQDASFAALLVEELLKLNQDKVDAGEAVRILQVQQGAGFNSPFDRRQVGYQPYLDNGKIENVERIAPVDNQNATQSMREVTYATLQKYNDTEDIDGIWCCYDAYAQGVYAALVEAGSNIPMVSVDICNEDIQFMQEGKNWKACATTNWNHNGEFACRLIALMMADEWDAIESCKIYADYAEANNGNWMELPITIVTQEQVMSKDGINIENLGEVADASYTDASWMPTCDWMAALLGH